MRLTAKQKADWVKALRSGEYEQGHSILRSIRQEHCCLGVLLRVIGDESKWELVGNHYNYGSVEEGEEDHDNDLHICLPTEMDFYEGESLVLDKFYIQMRPSKHINVISVEGAFVYMNDTAKLDFNQIADFIEMYLPAEEDNGTDPSGNDHHNEVS